MASYIKFAFKYLFQSDDYQAELERLNGTGSHQQQSAESEARGQQWQRATSLSPTDDDQSAAAAAVAHASAGGRQTRWSAVDEERAASGCQLLSRKLLQQQQRNAAALQQVQNPLRSFADFQAALRQLQAAETSATTASNETVSASSHLSGSLGAGQPLENQLAMLQNTTTTTTTSDLLGCFNQLQVEDYYAGYDILVGLRIASTLTILFVVFLMFVIYKTGVQEGRSQLSVVSSATAAAAAAKKKKPPLLPPSSSFSGRGRALAGHNKEKNGPFKSESKRRPPPVPVLSASRQSSGHLVGGVGGVGRPSGAQQQFEFEVESGGGERHQDASAAAPGAAQAESSASGGFGEACKEL